MKKILSSNKGFSLIELIVVIAILGVLVGVAAPNLIGYVEKTREATDVTTLDNVKRAAEAYVAENDTASGSITTEVADESFNNTMPTLRSAKGKTAGGGTGAITVSAASGVVTVLPSASVSGGVTTFTPAS